MDGWITVTVNHTGFRRSILPNTTVLTAQHLACPPKAAMQLVHLLRMLWSTLLIILRASCDTECSGPSVGLALNPEPYILADLSKRKRFAVAQFRSGILPLSIETGRFRGVEINNRICPVCSQMVEDEFHFLMQCPAYQDLRATMFNRIACDYAYFVKMDDLERFIFANINYQSLIGTYLLTAIERRKQCIYDI